MNKRYLKVFYGPQKLLINQLFRIMRITLLLIFISVFTLSAENVHSQNALVSLSLNNTPLKTTLNEIESQTDYLFIINSNVDINKKVSVHVKNAPVSKVLNDLFRGTNVNYAMEGTHIVLSGTAMDQGSPQEEKDVLITGTVIDKTNDPLPGVSVFYKGTSIGTATDIDGNFSLRIPERKGELVFSYIGYKPLTVPVGTKSILNVTLSEDTQVLDEVVVTAMGIERKAKSLTYSTQQIGGKETTRAKDANFINSLQGKSAGMVITPNSTGAGGSSKILLRGNKSILGQNQPLIVLDGVPMSDRSTTQIESDLLAGGNGTDGGDGLSNINPDDIETITILKGANAAALYGAKAGSGVIVITTKKGAEGRVNIEVSSSSLFETPLITPQFQNMYGAEVDYYDDKSINPNIPVNRRRLIAQSWGPRIGTLSDITLQEIPYARNSAQDNLDYFLRTGTNFNNSVAVSGGNKVSQSYFSYGFTEAQGMIPNNSFYRHNATFRESLNFFGDRLKLNFSGSYIVQKTNNRPGSGQYANPLYSLYTMPRNAGVDYFKDHSEVYSDLYTVNSYKNASNQDVYRRQGVKGPIQQWPWIDGSDDTNSPYWYMNRLIKLQRRERMYANIGAVVNVMDGLTAQARFKVDRTNDSNETKTYQGIKAKSIYNSIYEYTEYTRDDFYGDFLVTYNKKMGDFEFTANVGGSTQKEDMLDVNMIYWMGDTTAVPNTFKFTNLKSGSLASQGPSISKEPSQYWENALFATVQAGYKDMAYIEGTVRRDWARPYTQFKSMGYKDYYDYYSIGGNVFLDQMFHFKSDILNQLKLRVSYSEVGNSLPNDLFNKLNVDLSKGSAKAATYRSFINDPGPERVHSTEIGLDGKLFNRYIDFDITFYNALMLDQWLPNPSATGGLIPMNTAQLRNRGFETSVSYTLSPNTDFSWRTTINYSYNENKILQLYEDSDESFYDSNSTIFQGGLKVLYEVGRPYGELYGRGFLYEADGNTIKVDQKGAPILSSDYDCYLGNATAPHNLSWSNHFNYKDFFFTFLIDGKIGGKVISYTEARMDMFGVSKRTEDARNAGIYYATKTNLGGETVMQMVPGIIMPDGNIAPVAEYFQKIGGGEPVLNNYTYDATNFRMREVSLGYAFPSLFGNGKGLSISLVARNLFFLYKDSPVDPDVAVSTSNGFAGIEAFSLPTTRSYGINLKANF